MTEPSPPAPRSRQQVLWAAAVVVALAAAVLVRLHSASALWLDEALSVNIARLPLSEMPQALRQDGSPPLYYLLLHGWMAVVGTGTDAVRSLSSVFAVACLPAVWWAGRELRDARTGWFAVLLLGSSPFVVRYSAETRMYSLILLMVLLGVVALERALRVPSLRRLWPITVLSGLLLLTHYWALYLLAVVGAGLLVLAVRGPSRTAARRCAVALAAGGLLFAPWLPSFLFQAKHTGTPWVAPPKSSAVLDTLSTWSGGRTLAGLLLVLLLVAGAVLALLARRTPAGLLLSGRPDRTAGALLVAGLGTLVLGVVLAAIGSAGYAPRYSSVAVGPFLLAVALGLRLVAGNAGRLLLTVTVVLGLVGSAQVPLSHRRTQAAWLAREIRADLQQGDLVVYCPDQTGPAVSRLLPPQTEQVVYPTFGRPERIDWRDYAERNAQASPADFAAKVLARNPRTIWMVSRGDLLTFGDQCARLDAALTRGRGSRTLVVAERRRYAEHAELIRY
ncbi:MAG: glycosyltransferase family 39 protein [Mycobacteriales bacterium]